MLVEESHDTTVPQEEITPSELQAALQSPVSRRRISLFYQTGLLLVAVFMVLLPLAYIAFATLVGYCVYWYAVHAPGFLFSSLSGGVHVMIFRTIAYIGPLIAGGVAVFFMFKPLIARRRKRAEALELNPSQHPRLYQFIAHLSDLLRVSMPRRIYLDCELNADACAMSVAGSAGLESLLIRLRELTVLEHLAYEGLQQFWREGHQLPNSVPDFLEQLEQRLPPEFHKQAQLTLLNETAGLFATHPTGAQRIRKARRRGEPGIFALEKPARALFSDFAGTAQIVTARHYRQTLRLAVTPPMLKPVSAFFRES